jgi:mRNA-degrading endonuclease toxin of MazEF toxin-antitoxin module
VTTPLRGHLYWAILPGDKRRPVLVLSPNARNERAHDVIVAPLTTTLRPSPTHVRLRPREAGARAASVVACERITTLEREVLDPPPLGGPLSSERLNEVAKAVLRAIGVPIEPIE